MIEHTERGKQIIDCYLKHPKTKNKARNTILGLCSNIRMVMTLLNNQFPANLQAVDGCLIVARRESRNANNGTDHTEDVDAEMDKHAQKVVFETVIGEGVHFSDGILHPIEEQGMGRGDLISSLSLLDSQSEEGALVIFHQTETGAGLGVVEFAALEASGSTRAAIDTDGEELVLGRRGLVTDHDGRDAIVVKILEPHSLGFVDGGSFGEIDSAGVHELLSFCRQNVHVGVDVEVVDVVEGLHVEPEVHVAKNATGNHGDEARHGSEGVPHGVVVAAALAHSDDRENKGEGRGKTNEDPGPCRVLVVEGERCHGENGAEEEPRSEQIQDDRQEINTLAFGGRRENGALCAGGSVSERDALCILLTQHFGNG